MARVITALLQGRCVVRRLAVVLVVALLVQPHAARAARVLQHYDLDSLVDQSKAVVRAELGDPRPFKTADGDYVVQTATVLDAILGPAVAGTQIRFVGLDWVHQAPGLAGRGDSWEPLAKGDVVYLFLAPNDARCPPINADWKVIESGVRLVSGGKVYAFGQRFGINAEPNMPTGLRGAPYGFVAMTAVTFPAVPVETQREFDVHLRHAQQAAAQVNTLLATNPSPALTTQMIALLRSRAAMVVKEGAKDDELGRKVTARLADTLAPPDLVALRGDVGWDVRLMLDSGLQCRPAGRTYLLERIGDPKETAERRLEFAAILEEAAGWEYELSVFDARADQAASSHADFATSLARLAAANLGTALCAPLLRAIAQCDLEPPHPAPPNGALSADLDSAADVLADAFPKADRLDQFRIAETLMQVRPDRYKRVLPDAGPLLTLVEPDRDFDDAIRHRQLHLRCRFRNRLTVPTTLKLILRAVGGGSEVSLAINTAIGNDTDTFGEAWPIDVGIPDTAAGHYEVFLRDFKGDRPIGDGLPLQITVPPG
jgi:hypothetical protein